METLSPQSTEEPPMNTSLKKVIYIILLCIVALACVSVFFQWRNGKNVQHIVADTPQALRQQGFKTDLADFNFSTSAELRAREAALKAAVPVYRYEPFHDHPNLIAIVGNESAGVCFQQKM